MDKERKSHFIRWAVIVLLLLGVAARVFGAWSYRNNTDPDSGIVSLMAKHMAEGKEFPLFFYGQAYMGSLEPAFSALLCKLFGVSGFMVCLGTAIIAMLLLPLVYIWGNEAGGRIAGLAALAYCVIGPYVFFGFQVAPRGGYTLILLLGTAVTLLACRALAIEQTRRDAPMTLYLLIGLLAGLGWWTNQIIAYTLIAVTLLFFIVLKRAAFSLHILGPGLAGFFVGSLPLWVWNAQNDWETFSFLKSPGDTEFTKGIELLFTKRLFVFMGVYDVAAGIRIAVVLLLCLLVLLGLAALYQQGKQRKDARWLYGLSSVLVLLVGMVIFSMSRFSEFNTSRYLVPLVPPLAVLLGLATARMHKYVPPVLAWLPLTLLIVWQTTALGHRLEVEVGLRQRAIEVQHTSAFLREKGFDALYAPFAYHWMNFALREQVPFSDLKGERYKPYAVTAEQSDHIAIVGDHGRFSSFLHSTQATARKEWAGFFSVTHDFTPPPFGLREIALDRIAYIANALDRIEVDALTDHNLDTYWISAVVPQAREYLKIVFHEPTTIRAIRMQGVGDAPYPHVYQLYVDDEDRNPVGSEHIRPHFYWSGPRPYWHGEHFRMEVWMEPRTTDTLWIERPANSGNNDWQISELQLFEPAEEPPSELAAWPELHRYLRDSSINRLYCDRWVANKVHVAFRGAIRTPLEPYIYGPALGIKRNDPVEFTEHTALLVRHENAIASREVLHSFGLAMHETTIGPWILFSFSDSTWQSAYTALRNVYWLGYGCALGGAKELAATRIQRAHDVLHRGTIDAATVDSVLQAIELEPNFISSVPELSTWLHRVGRPDEAERTRQAYEAAAVPTVHVPVRYPNGIEFLGVRTDSTAWKPGQQINITYYWRVPEDIRTADWAVFAHFDQDETKFQNDHVLLSNYRQSDISFQPLNEIFHQKRRLVVPAEAPSGPYTLRFGVYDRVSGERLKPRTAAETDDEAVIVPTIFEVLNTSGT